MSGSIVFAGIAPHPPLLVPEVGGPRLDRVALSQEAMREFARRLVAARPETVVVISPHSPFDPRCFTARAAPRLRGDFGDFQAPQIGLDFPNDLALLDAIRHAAIGEGLRLRELTRDVPLDHGALVPLYYLRAAGWRGPIVVIGFTDLSNAAHLAFGQALARAARQLGRRAAVVASGDLSHRLVVGGPYSFEPTAHLFDEQVVGALAAGDARGVLDIDPDLRDRAGECGYRSIVVALGSAGEELRDPQVLSYEGPYGVGYMVAVLLDAGRLRGDMAPQELARLAVEQFVGAGEVLRPPAGLRGVLSERAGTFVCLRGREGELRGCVGTLLPTRDSVADEIIHSALGAASRDMRFPPVTADELPGLTYCVDVLAPPEPAGGPADLDPARYGVAIESEDRRRCGLLLPRIEGIETVEEQWQLVHHKAGIRLGELVRVWRFTVTRFGKD